MKNFPAYFQKELIENLRTYRLFIILIAFVIFALMEPVIYRMLPRILASEGLDPEVFGMMDTSQQGLLRSYIGNMIQTGILVFTLTLSGALAHEIQKNYWILPRTKRGNASALILSKYMLYSFGIIIVILISFFINRFYTGVLFESTGLTVLWTLQSGLIFSLYFLFILALLFFFVSLTRRSIAAAVTTMLMSFIVMPLLFNFQALQRFLPYGLVQESGLFVINRYSLLPLIASTTLLIFILLWGTIKRVKHMKIY